MTWVPEFWCLENSLRSKGLEYAVKRLESEKPDNLPKGRPSRKIKNHSKKEDGDQYV